MDCGHEVALVGSSWSDNHACKSIPPRFPQGIRPHATGRDAATPRLPTRDSLEAGVNITVGLPFVRTSVDHGTAFDIAGTGKADERSLVQALRDAVALAPKNRA